jgi:hypothetical protein
MNKYQKLLLNFMNAVYDRFGNYLIAGCFLVPPIPLIGAHINNGFILEQTLLKRIAGEYYSFMHEYFPGDIIVFFDDMIYKDKVKKAGILAAKEVVKLTKIIAKETALETLAQIPLLPLLAGKKDIYLSTYFILKTLYKTKKGV